MAKSKDDYIRSKIIPAVRGPGKKSGSKGPWDDPSAEFPTDDIVRGLSERNWQEQCYLIEQAHMHDQWRKPGGPADPAYRKDFTSAEGSRYYYKIAPPDGFVSPGAQGVEYDSDIMANMFSKHAQSEPIYHATPSVLSALLPYIRIWKVEYDMKSVATSGNNDTNDVWKGKTTQTSIPMDFNIHTTFKSINDILKGTSGKTDDIGLKSFSYKFHGGDMVTKEILKCDMVLHFHSVEGLIKPRESFASNGDIISWAWRDLIDSTETFDSAKKGDSTAYEIKLEIGWTGEKTAVPPDDKAGLAVFDALTGHGGKKQLFLNLYTHTLNFNQDGSLDLTVSFTGRGASRWRTEAWDLLWYDEREGNIREYEKHA